MSAKPHGGASTAPSTPPQRGSRGSGRGLTVRAGNIIVHGCTVQQAKEFMNFTTAGTDSTLVADLIDAIQTLALAIDGMPKLPRPCCPADAKDDEPSTLTPLASQMPLIQSHSALIMPTSPPVNLAAISLSCPTLAMTVCTSSLVYVALLPVHLANASRTPPVNPACRALSPTRMMTLTPTVALTLCTSSHVFLVLHANVPPWTANLMPMRPTASST